MAKLGFFLSGVLVVKLLQGSTLPTNFETLADKIAEIVKKNPDSVMLQDLRINCAVRSQSRRLSIGQFFCL